MTYRDFYNENIDTEFILLTKALGRLPIGDELYRHMESEYIAYMERELIANLNWSGNKNGKTTDIHG